jgi:hypothetical protein
MTKGSPRPDSGLDQERLDRLITAVEEVGDQLGVLRQVLDEIRFRLASATQIPR